MRWWGGFDLLRRLMFIISVTIFDFFQPDYEQVTTIFLPSYMYLGQKSIPDYISAINYLYSLCTPICMYPYVCHLMYEW